MVQPMERQLSLCSPWKAWGCRDPPAAAGGAHARAGGCLKDAVTLREARAGEESWQNLWREEPSLEKDCIQWKGTHAGALNEKQPLGRPHVGEIPEGSCLLWRDPTLEQGKGVRSPPPEEEGAAETM